MTVTAGFVVWFAEALLIAAISARTAGARVALVLAVAMLAFPAFVDTTPFLRSVLAVGALWCVVRGADFVFDGAPPRFGARLVHLFAIIDTRMVERGTRHVEGKWVAKLLLAAVVASAAILALEATSEFAGAIRYPLRWFAGAVLVLAVFELLTEIFRITTALLGLKAPAVSDTPHRSRSVSEFWSARWNLVVGKVLRDRVFKPLARHGTAAAIWATFAVSAALHAYIMGVAAGALPALAWAVFFLLQPLQLATERKLRIRRWPSPARRVWTIGALALLSPLFLEPLLRVIGPSW